MDKREPKQSQLDYLWVNFGNSSIASEVTDDLESVPSLGLILELLAELKKSAVGAVERQGSYIIVKSLNNVEITRFDIKELQGVTSITNYQKTVVKEDDIQNGCEYDLYTPVYVITLDNGKKLFVPVEIYVGGENNIIKNSVNNNVIYSEIKLSKNEDNGILLFQEQDGLSAQIVIDGEETGLTFTMLNTDGQYNRLKETKKNTIYFIKDRPYFYFNEVKIGSESEIEIKQIIKDVKAEFDEDLEKEVNRATKAESKLELSIEQTNENIESVKDYVRETKINLTNALNDKQPAGDYIGPDALEGYVKEEEYNTLKENFEALKKWTENMFKSDADTITDIRKGGQFTLVKDVKAEKDITLTKNTELDLGGHTLSAVGGTYGDNMVIGNGATITIDNGEIAPADKANLGDQSATIIVKTAYESHLTLTNTKVTGIYPVYLNSANESSSVIINSGEYYSSYEMNPAVYVGKGSSSSTTGGKVTIYGGTFGQKGVTSPYLLNVEDILRKQDGKESRDFIEVFGGTFINFNPSNCISEGEGTNFVAEGYTVETTIDGNDTIYKVIQK